MKSDPTLAPSRVDTSYGLPTVRSAMDIFKQIAAEIVAGSQDSSAESILAQARLLGVPRAHMDTVVGTVTRLIESPDYLNSGTTVSEDSSES